MAERESIKKIETYGVYVAVALSSILWGFTFLGSKIALNNLSAEEVLAARWTLAALLFSLMIAIRVRKVNYKGKPWYKILLMGLAQPCISALCETIGVDLTSPSISAIFYSMIPIVVTILSVFFLKEKLPAIEVIGVILALIGVLIALTCGDGDIITKNTKGLLLLIIMVLSSALFALLSKWALVDFKPLEITFLQSIAASIWFNFLVIIKIGNLDWVKVTISNRETLMAVVFLGAIGTFFCYIMYQIALEYIPTVQASTIQINLVSIAGVISGIIVNHDPWNINTIVGVALVLIGIFICNKDKMEEKIRITDVN